MCDVDFCNSCSTGLPNTCESCFHGFLLENGTCNCPEGSRLSLNGTNSTNWTNETNLTAVCIPCRSFCRDCFTDIYSGEVCREC